MTPEEIKSVRQRQRNPFGNFRLDLGTHYAIKLRWPWPRVRPNYTNWEPFFDWKEMKRGTMRDHGQRFRDLFETAIGLDDDDIDWQAVRPLGRGGFGVVGLFEKKNRWGQTEDAVVVKSAIVRQDEGVNNGRYDLSKEAVVMCQLLRSNHMNILYLRNFKYYNKSHQWRYYFEYCPYGDLDKIRTRYRAWFQYLPELFLWKVFRQLVEAMRVLDNGTYDALDSVNFGRPLRDSFILHCDIKPMNIFVGYEDASSIQASYKPLYGVPKLADFGLAEVTSLTRPDNLPTNFHKGTPVWYPPEIRYTNLRLDTAFMPFKKRDKNLDPRQYISNLADAPGAHKHFYRVGPEANLWAIGAVMYSLLTLDDIDYVDENLNGIMSQTLTEENDGHLIPPIETLKGTLPGGTEYSKALRELIRDCLKIRPHHRPKLDDLLTSIKLGTQKCVDKVSARCGNSADLWAAETKVCFTNEDMNAMPAGPYPFTNNIHFNNHFERNRKWDDPDHPLVRPTRPGPYGTRSDMRRRLVRLRRGEQPTTTDSDVLFPARPRLPRSRSHSPPADRPNDRNTYRNRSRPNKKARREPEATTEKRVPDDGQDVPAASNFPENWDPPSNDQDSESYHTIYHHDPTQPAPMQRYGHQGQGTLFVDPNYRPGPGQPLPADLAGLVDSEARRVFMGIPGAMNQQPQQPQRPRKSRYALAREAHQAHLARAKNTHEQQRAATQPGQAPQTPQQEAARDQATAANEQMWHDRANLLASGKRAFDQRISDVSSVDIESVMRKQGWTMAEIRRARWARHAGDPTPPTELLQARDRLLREGEEDLELWIDNMDDGEFEAVMRDAGWTEEEIDETMFARTVAKRRGPKWKLG